LLAFACDLTNGPTALPPDLAARLAASLSAGIGGACASTSRAGAHFAVRRPRGTLRGWRPAVGPDGTSVLFHGFIDNADQRAGELSIADGDLAALYAAAVARWDEEADDHLIGEWCAVVLDPKRRRVRLSRSALRAPPLHYARYRGALIAASVPRAIFAAGVPMRLNEQRVADSALLNSVDQAADWYLGLARVPLASVVEIDPAGLRTRKYYDVLAAREVRLPKAEDYVDQAAALLDEAVSKALAGAQRPGVTLSSGLDSSQLAARVAKLQPGTRKVPTFTFVPEPGWDGIAPAGMNGNEREMVEAFAALHPRLDPHFTDNAGAAQDHRWPEMFHLMGCAPAGMCNMYVLHGVWEQARAQGCDRLLIGEWGNTTFSDRGDWGFVEYLLEGRWRQLYLALRDHPNDDRSLLRKFVALSLVPLLPDSAWKLWKRIWHPREALPLNLISPLRPDYRARSGADRRARATGFLYGRYQPWNARQARQHIFANTDGEGAEIWQGFEQLYGVEQRDPYAYRPFAEFCFGLPTEMFLKDGERRWLAKQLAKGAMPEAQRINRLNGRWDADWHLRIGRKRAEWQTALDRIEADPRMNAMIDTPRLRRALAAFPAQTSIDPQVWQQIEMAVPFALIVSRFTDFVEGRNQLWAGG
jgi:asparagine synthase (glutamine-hydrolysing)